MAEEQQLFTTSEAASYLRYEPSTMQVWRCNAEGPAYIKLGKTVRYRRRDLDQWLYSGPAGRRQIEETAECHVAKRRSAKRLRGRALVAVRLQKLSDEPYCRDCRDQGRERWADEVDHIIPLSRGGTNRLDNFRSLCRSCHAIRTRDGC